ncbi:MAG TPA: ABC transporter permease, partial [Longimicrobiales bacterium]|nr:ABC transporter permease [Longimicrobiales bacterium]
EEEQPGHGNVVILSNGLWQRRFGSDPDILNRTIRLDGEPYTVVGVMPQDFRVVGETVDLWQPLVFDGTEQRRWHYLRAIGRLQPGQSLDAARREMGSLASRLASAFPDANQGIGVSLVPLDLRDTLTEGGRGGSAGKKRGRMQRGLVVAEIALALVLLLAAGLLVRGFANLRHVDLGFDTDYVLTFSIALPRARYTDTERAARFYRDAQARLAAIPGVETVGATTVLPFQGNNSAYYSIVGQPAPEPGRQPLVSVRSVLPGYFKALGIGLSRGRVFGQHDDSNAPPVAVVNEAMVRRHWPDGGAIGHQIRMGDTDYEIVGVVHDTHDFGPDNDPPAMVYQPALRQTTRGMSFALRITGDARPVTAAVRTQIHALDPDEPVFNVRTLKEDLQEQTGGNTIMAKLLAIFGLIALALAVVGVYGVMAYNVSQRTHEIGIRGALGAGRADIVRMVLGQAAWIAGLGSVIGLVLAAAVTRALSAFLFGVSAFDPVTFGGVTLALCIAAALASYIPARRAAAVDPMIALRDV